ncbi:MAG: Gfo/Idh/MocA family oxidoreductase [Kiritimatiellae bacterium]|nr:Gfo/Idh/MocA family oxidoreductase [Kiritimatiellia bacterium]
MDRRSFIKAAAMVGGAAGLAAGSGCQNLKKCTRMTTTGSMMGFRAEPIPELRVGIIGVGNRGPAAVGRLSRIEGVQITAISDLFEERVDKQVKRLKDNGEVTPDRYFGNPQEWRKLCESDKVDLVYICTPWLCHTPMAVYAMQCGKHAVTEVPCAMTIDECWELVETAEKTRRHFMMLENCCYGSNEMMMLNMCRQGALGDLVHGEAAYIHDLRNSNLSKDNYQDQWRLKWAIEHTGNPYPTHGLGPVCQYMNINRGDRFEYLSSISSDQFGLSIKAKEMYGENSPEAKSRYALGDMNTTIIKTYRGRTIMVQHDTTSPRPYTRLNTISGTKGIVADYPLRAAMEPHTHNWMKEKELESLKKKYIHPLWDKSGDAAKKAGGHGGMDFLMDLRLTHCLQHGLPLDMDVYDAAAWSSIVDLSERSVRNKGGSVKIPDFTRGGWKTTDPLGIVSV